VSDEPKSPEEQQATSDAVAESTAQAAQVLEQILDGPRALGLEAPPDPTFQLYDQHEARLQAEAAILEEACDIVLPEIKLVAKPIREATADTEPSENLGELEALCGSLPARHRQSEWLDVPAFHLDGSMNFLGAFTDAQDGDTGVLTSKAYYLLVDGRLVDVHLLGTWRVVGSELRDTRHTIVSTRVLTPKDVVAEVSLTDLFMKLRHSLHLSSEALEGQHAPDLAQRRARFDEIVDHYRQLVAEHAEGLRRVGDSPA
jgi:hypothetical protein